jgi:glyoxylate reductase
MPNAPKKPLVIVTRKLPEIVETRMRELFNARLNLDDAPLSQAALVEAAKAAEVLVPTVTDRIDRAVLSQAGPQLKLIANFGTGVDNIDLDTARNRGITVTNTPGVLTEDTADMTMALILAVPRRLVEGANLLRDPRANWTGSARPWRAAPPPSACRCTITIAAAFPRPSSRNSMPPTGTASTRCWRGWISSR